MMTAFESPAFIAGKEARLTPGISKIPYPKGTEEAKHWETGFQVADLVTLALHLNKGPSNRAYATVELTEAELAHVRQFLFPA